MLVSSIGYLDVAKSVFAERNNAKNQATISVLSEGFGHDNSLVKSNRVESGLASNLLKTFKEFFNNRKSDNKADCLSLIA